MGVKPAACADPGEFVSSVYRAFAEKPSHARSKTKQIRDDVSIDSS